VEVLAEALGEAAWAPVIDRESVLALADDVDELVEVDDVVAVVAALAVLAANRPVSARSPAPPAIPAMRRARRAGWGRRRRAGPGGGLGFSVVTGRSSARDLGSP
jgi:hypothetical protein